MYFQNFPYTYYSLDDKDTVQVLKNITLRFNLSDEVKNNLSLFDEYDIKDGETPEIVADRFYNNPLLHWVILHTNDITDARFGWPLSTNNLFKYATDKYNNINAPHHYTDVDGNYVNATVILNLDATSNIFNTDNVITNVTNSGNAYIVARESNSNVTIKVTDGGFITGDTITLSGNVAANANITSTSVIYGIPVSNFFFEDGENEDKRRIKILKSEYVDAVVAEFTKKLGEV